MSLSELPDGFCFTELGGAFAMILTFADYDFGNLPAAVAGDETESENCLARGVSLGLPLSPPNQGYQSTREARRITALTARGDVDEPGAIPT